MSAIIFVSFLRPVTFNSTGNDYWSATEAKHKDVACVDKGNHLLFTMQVAGKPRRVKVPLTNICQVTEEGAEEKAK